MCFCNKSSTFAVGMKITSLLKSSAIRNFAKLLSANVVAQVIGLLIYPILTRMYAPEDFGLLNLFLSIGNVLVVLALADYYYSIVLPKDDRHAAALVHTSFFLLLSTTALVALSIFFARPISMIFKSPDLARYYWMLPIYVCVMGAWNILNYWFVRQKQFGRISAYQISQSVLSAGAKITLGSARVLQAGMIYSVVVAPAISLISSLVSAPKKHLLPLFDISFSDVREQSKVYRNFPLFVLPRSFINVLAGQLPVLLLTPFFGAKFVGLLSMAVLLGFTPIGTISRAIYQVLYQDTTQRVHAGQTIGAIYWRFVGFSTLIVLPVFGVLLVVLPDLTEWLLGSDWRVVGEYIRWMLPWLYLSLIVGSTCYLSDVFMQQKTGLLFEILLAICRVAGLGLGIYSGNFLVAIIGYSIGTALAVLAQFVWLSCLVRNYDKGLAINKSL